MTACKTSSQLFAAARDAQTELAGVRVKVRLPNALHRDITACAAACRIPLADWTAAACRRVPATRKREKATRADSLTVWLRAPAGMPPAEIRSRLRAAADLAIPRIPPTPTNLILPLDARPGIDYLIEKEPRP